MGETIHRLLGGAVDQIGGTFLHPGSALFLPSLLVTLAICIPLAVPRATRRPRLAVIRRALLPRRLWRSRSGRVDAGFFLFSLLGGGATFAWALLSSALVREWARPALAAWVPPLASGLPAGVIVAATSIVTFVAFDFGYWLDHRLKHRVPALWAFHKVHHSAESLSLLTNFRVHPVDTLIFYNIVALTVGIAAASCDALAGARAEAWSVGGTGALTLVAGVLLTHLQHSHLWVTFGPRWGAWLLGPAHHQIHHSADPRHFDRNFGNVLTCWDRLGGSFHHPAARREAIRFGLDASGTQSLAALTLTPFAEAGASLVRAAGPAGERAPA